MALSPVVNGLSLSCPFHRTPTMSGEDAAQPNAIECRAMPFENLCHLETVVKL